MIYGYCKVSTKGQAKDGNSLEAQEKELQENGAVKIYRDSQVFAELFFADDILENGYCLKNNIQIRQLTVQEVESWRSFSDESYDIVDVLEEANNILNCK